ncbi:hypothetical protein O3P69_010038 [Scylla paramamosain]|uniref:Uncharacterized protein n=1 Tax=Scylla paramamosain TaxID=85552 RepID=A0AAW0SP08_SCYPA
MLTLDPAKRMDADSSLNHDFFWVDPLPCDLGKMLSHHTHSMFEFLAPPRRGKQPQQQQATQPQPSQAAHSSQQSQSSQSGQSQPGGSRRPGHRSSASASVANSVMFCITTTTTTALIVATLSHHAALPFPLLPVSFAGTAE